MLSILLAVPSCFNSFWHGVIPTSYFRFLHLWGPVAGVGSRVGKLGKFGISHGKGEGHVLHAGVCNVCGSAHSCGCVVNGSFARVAPEEVRQHHVIAI